MRDTEWMQKDWDEMDRITDENRPKYPDEPTTIRGLAYEIVTSKHEDLRESAKEWLDLADCHPNHPLCARSCKRDAESNCLHAGSTPAGCRGHSATAADDSANSLSQ